MNILLFGSTGMLGQAALRECLADPEVRSVLAITRTPRTPRTPTSQSHAKLRELVVPDLFDVQRYADDLAGQDACIFCLGVSAAGMSEANYRHITYDLTLAIAREIVKRSPNLTFVYVSGTGTDSRGRSMWARVKGETESALLALPLRAAYMFRPGYIQPLHGVKSRTPLYSTFYAVLSPLYPVLRTLLPKYVTDSERVARGMLIACKRGAPKQVLESSDIDALAS
jgi:uncharacterized protein YbjT (DUF2867 family)